MVCSSHACPSLALLRGPSKSGMVMASIMMDQMLLACQGFTHVKKVVAAVAVCLEQALAMLASSGAEGNWSRQSETIPCFCFCKSYPASLPGFPGSFLISLGHGCCAGSSELAVPEVFLPLQRCAETLSIGLDAASVRRMLTLCFRAAAPNQPSWQVRQQAVLTVAALARAVRMDDPLFPGEGRLVSTPAVRWLQQERGAIMEVLERVRYDKVRTGHLTCCLAPCTSSTICATSPTCSPLHVLHCCPCTTRSPLLQLGRTGHTCRMLPRLPLYIDHMFCTSALPPRRCLSPARQPRWQQRQWPASRSYPRRPQASAPAPAPTRKGRQKRDC